MQLCFNRKEKTADAVKSSPDIKITYQKIFWLFIIGSILGVPLEGVWCLLKYGHWETHVVTIWGPFCIIYGLGAVGCYVGSVLLKGKNIALRFLTFALIGDAVEIICGAVLEYGLNMYAWDYSTYFMNFKGYVCLFMTVIWGVLGIAFGCAVPFVDGMLEKMSGKIWNIACICLSAFMVVNFLVTAACFVRWKHRHEGDAPQDNRFQVWMDENYDDERMATRYCEWRFFE